MIASDLKVRKHSELRIRRASNADAACVKLFLHEEDDEEAC